METTYTFIADCGHGWLTVPAAELAALGIADTISRFSYQSRDGATAYLEEDCDAARFFAAKLKLGADPYDMSDVMRATGCEVERIQSWCAEHSPYTSVDGDCFIRKLPRYGGAVRVVAQSR